LESAVLPLGKKVSQLEKVSTEAEVFSRDRAKLASELDIAKAEHEAMEANMNKREKEFESLADETTQELDRVIRHVQSTLERLPS